MCNQVRRAILTTLLFQALGLTGCLSAARQAFEEARGARGETLVIRESAVGALVRPERVEFTPATSRFGPRIVPPVVLPAYDASARQLMARLPAPSVAARPPVIVDTEMLYFQRKSLLSGGLLLAHVIFRIAEQPAAELLVRAESDAFRAGSEDDLANAAVEAVRKYLRLPDREVED